MCIPARWHASRLPGKLLARLPDGRCVLETTVDIARASGLGPVVLLAGDEQIEEAAAAWPVEVARSAQPARNGSERIAEALRSGVLGHPLPPFVVNLQGDAVGAHPALLRTALDALAADPEASLGTVAVRLPSGLADGRPTVQREGARATDFSRTPLPNEDGLLLHIGIYAYRTADLLDVAALEPTPRELEESLEQLRWIESGRHVALAVVDGPPELAWSVDEPADLLRSST